MYSLRWRRLRGDVIEMFKMIYGIDKLNLGKFYFKMIHGIDKVNLGKIYR